MFFYLLSTQMCDKENNLFFGYVDGENRSNFYYTSGFFIENWFIIIKIKKKKLTFYKTHKYKKLNQ